MISAESKARAQSSDPCFPNTEYIITLFVISTEPHARVRISDTGFSKQLRLLISEEQNLLSAEIEKTAIEQKCVFSLSVNFEDFVGKKNI